MKHYRAPRWLAGAGPVGAHLQTIWPALFSRVHAPRNAGAASTATPSLPCVRERWVTPDQDFIDVDTVIPEGWEASGQPMLVLFHGLEGSSQSHYALAFGHWAQQHGVAYVVPHFRGCSGELNRGPRFYHSGDFAEVDWILRRVHTQWGRAILAVGISLGGNVLLRWAQETGAQASAVVSALAAVCSPVDLAAAGHAIGRGFNRLAYNRMFLNTLKPKALAKLQQYPGLFNREALLAARDLYAYDNVVTAPLHGFANTEDYWRRCSAKPGLKAMKDVPTLVLHARNDPFVPASSLPVAADVGPAVTLWQPLHGGHVGFAAGGWPGHVAALPASVCDWLIKQGSHHG